MARKTGLQPRHDPARLQAIDLYSARRTDWLEPSLPPGLRHPSRRDTHTRCMHKQDQGPPDPALATQINH